MARLTGYAPPIVARLPDRSEPAPANFTAPRRTGSGSRHHLCRDRSGWLYLARSWTLQPQDVAGRWTITCAPTCRCRIEDGHLGAAAWRPDHHSDRGFNSLGGLPQGDPVRGFQASMSRKGDCYDNPDGELLHTLKTELVHHRIMQPGRSHT